jgi:hypothetical protein
VDFSGNHFKLRFDSKVALDGTGTFNEKPAPSVAGPRPTAREAV